jgi:starch synthase
VRQRAADLIGILNGVDYGQWSPWTDPFITCHYRENSLSVKEDCKRSLRRTVGLPDKGDTPVIAMISRLTSQKGFDLVESIFASLMQRDIQFVLLGAGESRYEQFFRGAASRHPDRVGLRIGFDEPLAHQIEAGADIFLMPSLFEPCGLNQMFSLKYGTIPIVRAVGGLKDTVQQCNTEAETGTGFVFEPYEAQALLRTIDQSLQVFHDKKAWAALRRRAMAMDFSWERSAKRYAHLYRQLLN